MSHSQEAQNRNKKFSIVGLNIGPTFGPSRTGDFTVNGRAQFFSPFGGDGTHAVQAQGEYMYYPGHQEGQFDIGLVNRWGNVQAGGFASFKYLDFKGDQSGGGLGQFAFLMDYLFSDGRIGLFGTQGFKSIAVLNSTTIAPGTLLQTYAQVVNQYGINYLFGVWGNATIEGNLGYLRRQIAGQAARRPEPRSKLTQPIISAYRIYGRGRLQPDAGRLRMTAASLPSVSKWATTSTPRNTPRSLPRCRWIFRASATSLERGRLGPARRSPMPVRTRSASQPVRSR